MRPTFVYFIECVETGAIKIGYSANAMSRLSALQVGSPSELRLLLAVPGTQAHEKKLHNLFRRDRISGEWFSSVGAVPAFVAWLSRLTEAEQAAVLDREPSLPTGYLALDHNQEAAEQLDRLLNIMLRDSDPKAQDIAQRFLAKHSDHERHDWEPDDLSAR